ncbi:MAG TPA: hypothetical protein VFR81_19095 [Longimicrobium sp.]|nr:hypothetical protein [Longimicrobium sp.]
MPRSRIMQFERVLSFATRFLEEVRGDIERARMEGSDTPPRLRCIHERPGHATPEFRTLNIPVPEGLGGLSPDVLSGIISRYAEQKRPDCLLLALEAETADGLVLIAEARCKFGTRMFWMQPYTVTDRHVKWGDPMADGWRDPGEEEMILDAAFPRPVAAGTFR